MKLDQRMQSIELILSDVDGVMTDGLITYDNLGIETKSFHVRDGLGIKLWQRAGHHFGILTARTSHIVKLRASELGVELVRQGVDQKLPVAIQIIESLDLQPEQVCYIGDDLADLEVLNYVGLPASVSDGAAEVRAAAKLVTKSAGGRGAIRELVETILDSQKRWADVLVDYSNS
ncbi:MAG: HAD-IIIA family hydrolase [Mariniblastus sp.]|nr:HAD-IIIA family hydrolase [Mariniblastus sp.]